MNHLLTTATFPVRHGTVVTVSCDSDHVLKGSHVITCDKDKSFFFSSTPSCVNKGECTEYAAFSNFFLNILLVKLSTNNF